MVREEYNENEMRLNLDLLEERRETAAIREARYKSKMEQYYNKKVRQASFNPGEFVFRRNEGSRVEDQGKLGPKWEGPYRVMEAYENGSYKLQTLEDKEVPRSIVYGLLGAEVEGALPEEGLLGGSWREGGELGYTFNKSETE
ncbi:reverse transcriptase domain-containing protein [Tanacetum coccineum]